MSRDTPLVWIVIPTWNRRDDLLECLASVWSLAYQRKRVVVVDNGSSDGTADAVRSHCPKCKLIELDENVGAAAASNAGFDYALENGADFTLRLDSDTVVAPDFLTHLLAATKTSINVGLVVGKIYYYSEPTRIWSMGARQTSFLFTTRDLGRGLTDEMTTDQIQEIDFAWSAGILLSRQALESTGGFDTDFFVYHEEMDLCERARKAGIALRATPYAEMWHKVGQTANSRRIAFNWARGKMLFFRKHSKGFHKIMLIVYAYLYALFRAMIPKAGAGNRGPLGAALSGLNSGLRHPLGKR